MSIASAETQLQRAAAALAQGAFDVALAAANAALLAAPAHPEGLHLRGMILSRLGQHAAAITALEAALAVHPQKAAVLSNLGNAHRRAGNLPAAVTQYRAAVAADPALANAWYNLGLTLLDLDAPSSAADALSKATACAPGRAAIWHALGAAQDRALAADAARAAYDRALAIEPGLVAARANRARLQLREGEVAAVLDDLAPLAAAANPAPGILQQFANAKRMAGDLAAAEAALRRALTLTPAAVELHRDLANLCWEQGQGTAFTRALDQAIAATAAPDLLALRAELVTLAGDAPAGMAAAEVALAQHPAHAGALAALSRAARLSGAQGQAIDAARRLVAARPADVAAKQALAEVLLAAGEFSLAIEQLPLDVPDAHLQRQVGLRALALRAIGAGEYHDLYDYDRFTAQIDVPPPAGYATIAAFNEALAEVIRPLHQSTTRPLDQTLFGGTQSPGRLWSRPEPVIRAFAAAMREAAAAFVSGLPRKAGHPFLRRRPARPTDLACAGAWSVVLRNGGGHVDHMHPAGWISASYYIAAPAAALGPDRAGHLRLGASGVPELALPAERWFAPRPGTLVLFASYIWHGVEPFFSASPRITAPFDLAPLTGDSA